MTARAVAPLPELVELAVPLLAPGGTLIAWKRGDITDEVAGAERALAALGGGSIQLRAASASGLAGHCLAVVTARGGAPVSYPRDPGTRRRRPW